MSHVAQHILRLILDALGMNQRGQVVTFCAILILAFALYAGKQFATQKVYATLYLTLGLAFCVFMTTHNPQTRLVAAVALCVAIAALFTWYLATRPRGPEPGAAGGTAGDDAMLD